MEKSSDKVQEMVWKTKVGRSECGMWNESLEKCFRCAKDAMVDAMCQARLDTVIVDTDAEATRLQREAAPLPIL